MLAQRIAELSDAERALVSEEHMRNIQMGATDFSEDRKVLSIQLTKSLLENQTHLYYHVPSCTKKTNSTVCRYHFPRGLVEQSGFNEHGIFEAKRRIGNQWLNPFITVWRRCFPYNMDATMISDGSGPQKALYCTKYATKHQSLIDNVHIIEMAFEKKLLREDGDKEQTRRGLGRLLSMAFASAGCIEVGGTLAAHFILRGEAGYFSHKFQPLLLAQALNLMHEERVESMLEQVGDHYTLSAGIYDYMYRDAKLEDVSWTTFCSWYIKQRQSKKKAALRFTDQHSQADTHMLQRFEEPRIPQIMGPRLPDSRQLHDEELEEKYYRMCLCLFKPFRHPKDLLELNAAVVPAKAAFKAWFEEAGAEVQHDVRRRQEFHQEYHLAMDGAKAYHENMRKEAADLACESGDIDTAAALRHHNEVREASSRATECYEDMWRYLNDEDTSIGDDPYDGYDEEDAQGERLFDVQHLIPPVSPPAVTLGMNDGLGATITPSAMKRFVKQIATETSSSPSASAETPPAADEEVRVTTLEQIMQNLTATPPGRDADASSPNETVVERAYPSVNEVSKMFKLNELQHIAFTRYAVPLLHKLLDLPFDAWDTSPLCITGAGGTGKSRIVGAIQYLVKKWGRPNAVRVMAPTGVAAAALGGTTLHSSISLPINSVTLPSRLQHPCEELLEQWQGVCGAIIDEFFMIGKYVGVDTRWKLLINTSDV